MGNWNPNATGTLGLEWMPEYGGAYAIDGPTKVVATQITQTASQAITTVLVPNVGLTRGQSGGGIYAVEVYDGSTGVPVDAVTSLEAVPGADVATGGWINQASGTTNLFQSIDEGSAALSTADYIRRTGQTATYRGRFSTLALTGKRIVGVQLSLYSSMSPSTSLQANLGLSGTDYPAFVVYGPHSYRWDRFTWLYNPATKKPWTIADITALNTTDSFSISATTPSGFYAVDVAAVTLTVYFHTENRLAVGTLDDSGSALTSGTPSVPVWNSATLTTPTGGTWTKAASGSSLYTVRRINGQGTMNVPFLDAVDTSAPYAASWAATLDPTWGYVNNMDDSIPVVPPGFASIQIATARTKLHPFIARLAGPTDSTDSVPYVATVTVPVSTGVNAEQEFSGAAATNYGLIKFWAYKNPANAATSLDVKVKRRSDNVQFGTTFSLTPALWNTLAVQQTTSGAWHLVAVSLATPAGLAITTQYYVEWSSAVAAGQAWGVLAYTSLGSGQLATYDGTTDAASYPTGSRNTSADLGVTLASIPTAPASMTAALGSQAVDQTVNCVAAISRADLSWSATALAGTFLRYEIQRSEDAGTTWVDIARVTVESVVAWKDYEGRRGVACSYRIRVVRTDLAVSLWTQAGATVTKPLLAGTGAYGATLFLVTNYNPTQNLAYEATPVKDYTFNEASEQTLEAAYMRDYQLGANPIENRGISAKWAFIVGIDDMLPPGSVNGWNAFNPLRNLARAVIPYVCILDHRGNRMLAQLSVPSGNEDSSGQADRYIATVGGSEMTATPFVVTVTS